MMLTKKCRDRLELLRTLGIVERDLLPYMLILEETEMHEARLRSILTFEAACAQRPITPITERPRSSTRTETSASLRLA